MTQSVPLKCSCGAVAGQVKLDPVGTRLVCTCQSCRAFALHLERGDDVLDAYGGSDIYQVTPSQVTITKGVDQLRVLCLSEGGTLRWFTACCKTPICNTLAKASVPFVGLISVFMDHEGDGRSRDAALGPVTGHAHLKFATDRVPDANPLGPMMLLGIALNLAKHALAGRARPTPFFDDARKLIVEPLILTSDERVAAGLSAEA